MSRQVSQQAVLFADISDSTSLYQKLGDEAARRLVDASLNCISGVLPAFKGRLVKLIGDEIMCVFPSADLGVLAAIEMQARITAAPPAQLPVTIHVGMHFGPVLMEANDLFGDTVNSAAYLAAMAGAQQILTTDATYGALSDALKPCVRPVFHAVLKGASEESIIHQVLWQTGNPEITDVNLYSRRTLPEEGGSLVVALGETRRVVDQWRPVVRVGRAAGSDIVITDRFASRKHFTIKLDRTHYYLVDHSINGTFVQLSSGDEVHVLRGELLLDGSGRIQAGRNFSEQPVETITFAPDRRSQYRL